MTYSMKNDEIIELCYHLQRYSAIFNKFVKIGTPLFDEKVRTLEVSGNKNTGDFFGLRINPDFWNEANVEQKIFYIGHECLHLILSHLVRLNKNNINKNLHNYAADLVVNHTLESMGFVRSRIDPNNRLCWIDKFFEPSENVKTGQTLEYYYLKLLENNKSMDDESLKKKFGDTLDDHNEIDDETLNEIIKQITDNMSDAEKQEIKKIISNVGGSLDGSNSIEHYFDIQIKKKRKWETIIKKWESLKIKENTKIHEQWAHTNRRGYLLNSELMLPSDREQSNISKLKDKLNVFFFVDTSPSCGDLIERFYKAANSLPEDKFNVRFFSFHTAVKEFHLNEKKIESGYGTRFDIIEHQIQHIIKTENLRYPDVFILTDGAGNMVKPERPEKWYWFLTDRNTQYIDKKSKFFDLKDYE